MKPVEYLLHRLTPISVPKPTKLKFRGKKEYYISSDKFTK